MIWLTASRPCSSSARRSVPKGGGRNSSTSAVIANAPLPVIADSPRTDQHLLSKVSRMPPSRPAEPIPLVCRPDLLVTEESLELDAPFRELFAFAPVAYHEIDAAGTLCRVNQTEYRLLGYPAAEMIGKPVWQFAAADQQENWRQTIEQRISGQEEPSLPLEIDFVRRDRGYLILEIYDSLIRSRSGQITGIRSMLLDIT